MKTNALLFLASLAVLATNASAAQSQPEAGVVVLPTYVVNAPRYQPAELKIMASLNQLRQQALTPAGLAIESPILKDKSVPRDALVKAAKDAKIVHIANL